MIRELTGYVDMIQYVSNSKDELSVIIVFDSLREDSATGNELELLFPASFAKNLQIGQKITASLEIHEAYNPV
jgi:hypothetical protein